MQRVKDIVAMYLNKVTAFEAFFAEAFHTEKIRRIYDTFCRPFEIQEITDREITTSSCSTSTPQRLPRLP
jgi:hypothetical protein